MTLFRLCVEDLNIVQLRGGILKKSAVILDFVLVQLFPNVEIQDLKVSVGLKIPYMHFNTLNIYIQPKNILTFKLLAFWRMQTPVIDQK